MLSLIPLFELLKALERDSAKCLRRLGKEAIPAALHEPVLNHEQSGACREFLVVLHSEIDVTAAALLSLFAFTELPAQKPAAAVQLAEGALDVGMQLLWAWASQSPLIQAAKSSWRRASSRAVSDCSTSRLALVSALSASQFRTDRGKLNIQA